jgi:hypothetical protein
MSEKQIILDGMKPLFERARKEKLIFRSTYRGAIFTPDELEKKQADGYFIWGPVNWELVEPGGIIAGLKKDIERAQREYQRFLDRIKAEGYEA